MRPSAAFSRSPDRGTARARRRVDPGPRIAAALAGVAHPPPADARYEILGADAEQSRVVLLVSIHIPGQPAGASPLTRFGEAILLSAAECRVVHLQRAPAP